MSEKINLQLYAVRNSDGQFFRAKGYGGGGATWVDDLCRAKIYANIGQARSRVTFFANNYPKYPTPQLIVIKANELEILDETERVEKAKQKKLKEVEQRKINEQEWKIEQAQKDLKDAQDRLKKLIVPK